jgi:NAD(P)-dependent dehydrogenase (short-subunit alcohol dehydrogenase family)
MPGEKRQERNPCQEHVTSSRGQYGRHLHGHRECNCVGKTQTSHDEGELKMRWDQRTLILSTFVGAAVLAGTMVALRQRRISFQGRTVIITGGSRGLGLELARCWGAEGAKLFLCARTADQLSAAVNELRGKGYAAEGFACDVRSVDQVRNFIQRVVDQSGRIDVLVNNAGVIQTAPQKNMMFDDYRDAIDTHLWGPLYLIEAALPYMRRRGEGRIVNIASIGGEISVPHLLPYCASKFALVGLSEGLSTELAADGIKVTTVCPGLMRTGSPRNALFKGQHRKEYAWFSISSSIPGITISSKRAARQIVHACRVGQPYLSVSLPSKVAIKLHALLPGLSVKVMRVINELLPAPTEDGYRSRKGRESFSAWSPSRLTRLTEQAAIENNEV